MLSVQLSCSNSSGIFTKHKKRKADTETAQHVFYKPVLNLPDSFSNENKQRLTQSYREAIENIIKPAYKKLHDYIVNRYIPGARTSSGLSDNTDGKNEYRYWLRFWTTQDPDPDSLFALGISEVARNKWAMDSVKTATGFNGRPQAFFEYVKTDQKFFPFTTEEQVLDEFRSLHHKIMPAVNRMFNLVPGSAFEIRATEKFRQAGANAQYMRPAPDGSRPGIFYEVIPDPKAYNAVGMETLFLHEAIPGHHFQVACSRRWPYRIFEGQPSLALFQKDGGYMQKRLALNLVCMLIHTSILED
jgi:uncharacterized protein (DUF885 family)